MNFLNPYIEIYLRYRNEDQHELMPFYREVLWLFSKNLDNRLRMFQHRVNIEIEEGYDIPQNCKFDSIYSYQTSIDLTNFKKLDEHSKRKQILELVHSGFNSLAEEFNWDKEAIADAYKKSVEENYGFVYYTDYKLSRNRKFKGRIRIDLDKRLAIFTSELLGLKTGDLRTAELLQTAQGNFAWWRYIREFGWMDSENFGLKLKNGQVWITINTISGEVTGTINPKKSDYRSLEDFLKKLKEPIKPLRSVQ